MQQRDTPSFDWWNASWLPGAGHGSLTAKKSSVVCSEADVLVHALLKFHEWEVASGSDTSASLVLAPMPSRHVQERHEASNGAEKVMPLLS
jgi:hypothetical protein